MTAIGYIDSCGAGFIGGWAWDPDRPNEYLAVDIVVDGQLFAQVIARQYRQDLKDVGIGDGRHAYEYALPSWIDPSTQEISVVVAKTTVYLPYSNMPNKGEATPTKTVERGLVIDCPNGISRYFELQRKYAELYRSYIAHGVKTTLNPNDNEFAPGTPLEDYLRVGVDALRVIVNVLVSNVREPPRSILDFPSGSGRVTRHLQAFFPEAKIVASDLYDRHLKFCVDQLGAEGILSQENLDDVDFGWRFDLIFCGSLLTHLPEGPFRAAFRLLSRSLNDTGIAIVTLHGRHSEYIQENYSWRYFEDELYEIARSTISEKGFGYADYKGLAGPPLFDNHAHYGVSFSRPHWSLKMVEADDRIRILGYIERGWHDHQDVLVFGRPGIND